jgi:predicted dehydrogenase
MGSLHARVVHQSPRAELHVVIDPRPSVGQQVADRHGARWAPDLAGLAGADAVIVAAATEAHEGLAIEVIRAGLPLLMEKPLADDLRHSHEIVSMSAKAGVPLMCGLLERYNGAVMTAQLLTRDPVHVRTVRHSPYAPRMRTGVAWDLLVHDVDIVLRLTGDTPTRVEGYVGYFHPDSASGAEDVAEAALAFPDGAIAACSASRIGHRKVRRMIITEIDREIEVDLLRRDVTVYRHVANSSLDEGLGYRQQTVIEIPELVSSREPLAAQLDRFVDLVEGAADAESERDSILPAHRVIDAVVSSLPGAAAD